MSWLECEQCGCSPVCHCGSKAFSVCGDSDAVPPRRWQHPDQFGGVIGEWAIAVLAGHSGAPEYHVGVLESAISVPVLSRPGGPVVPIHDYECLAVLPEPGEPDVGAAEACEPLIETVKGLRDECEHWYVKRTTWCGECDRCHAADTIVKTLKSLGVPVDD